MTLSEQDWDIRLYIYRHFVEQASPPTVTETAQHFNISIKEAHAVYQRLHEYHTLFLQPGTDQIRMANPLSALPTDYRVNIDRRWLWANCAWDSLGIPAMLGADAHIEARLPLTGETVTYRIEAGVLKADQYIIHFPLPFARWYDDLVDT
jgi:Alkylmercury lyase